MTLSDELRARHGFLRVAVASPALRVGDVAHNAAETLRLARQLAGEGCRLVVFPEMGLTGYTCGDLLYQETLLEAARRALLDLAAATAGLGAAVAVGLPLAHGGRLYNVAAILGGGRVAGLVPKVYLPTGREFYDARWYASGAGLAAAEDVALAPGISAPLGTGLLFALGDSGVLLGAEICEDLWAPEPPSGRLAVAGAQVLVNLSASNELLGKSEYRRELVRQQSARLLAAYLYACAGPGESTTDVVFAGHSLIAENGRLRGETPRLSFAAATAVADLDLGLLDHERRQSSSFRCAPPPAGLRVVPVALGPLGPAPAGLAREVRRHPFVPADPAARARHCEEIFALQATALARRLLHVQPRAVVLGTSGGLDSTLALLVALRALELAGLPRRTLAAVSLPGLGTTARTRGNAARLAALLGVDFREISIVESVELHFRDIGHPPDTFDLTYENAQARERTQVLMDLASRLGGFVLGTGDLSEAALGWCTFNGDHMSMYHVNIGVPKTLVRYLVGWAAEQFYAGETAAVLRDVCATPISPELLPPDAAGAIQQETEKVVGPYELHDFFLYHFVRYGAPPDKVEFLARRAFAGAYADAEIRRWLAVFLRRFFSQQFKRNALPDGPKIGSVALSPRGDWRMPSDAAATAWLDRLERPPPAASGNT